MNFTKTKIPGVYVVEMELRVDERGIFAEAYNSAHFDRAGIPFAVSQMNISVSARRGTVRGMHWQEEPFGQAKLVRCIKGHAWDVVVDVRVDSATFGDHVAIDLTPENRRAALVPKGCAHGWQALVGDSEIEYLVDGLWSKPHERGLRPDDPRVGIRWPAPPVFVSERDRTWPDLAPRT